MTDRITPLPREFWIKEQIITQFAEGTTHIAYSFKTEPNVNKIQVFERIENQCVRCGNYTSLFNHDYHVYVCDACSPTKREAKLEAEKAALKADQENRACYECGNSTSTPIGLALKMKHEDELATLRAQLELCKKQRNLSIRAEVEHYEDDEAGRVGAFISKLDLELQKGQGDE